MTPHGHNLIKYYFECVILYSDALWYHVNNTDAPSCTKPKHHGPWKISLQETFRIDILHYGTREIRAKNKKKIKQGFLNGN